jgi:hypothetical protein
VPPPPERQEGGAEERGIWEADPMGWDDPR